MSESKTELVPVKRGRGRPPKVLSQVPQRSLPERAKVINEYHAQAQAEVAIERVHKFSAVQWGVMAGLELAAAKAECAHGHWETWAKENISFAIRTAQRYMAVAEELSKTPHVSFLTPPSQLDQHGLKLLSEAIDTAAGGETLRQLYIDFGIVNAPRDYGAFGGDHSGKRKELSMQEREDLMLKKIRADWIDVLKDLGKLGVKDQTFRRLDRDEAEKVEQVLRQVADAITDHLKR